MILILKLIMNATIQSSQVLTNGIACIKTEEASLGTCIKKEFCFTSQWAISILKLFIFVHNVLAACNIQKMVKIDQGGNHASKS